jgi:hypothetical protein
MAIKTQKIIRFIAIFAMEFINEKREYWFIENIS